MIPTIRAEFRKLLTVRSTYVIAGICFALTILIAFYANGYHLSHNVADTNAIKATMKGVIQLTGLLVSIVAILLVTHEYRYNTIMYSLTMTANRIYVLAAKVVCITAFALVMGLIVALLSAFMMRLGLQAKGLDIIAQQSSILSALVPCLLYYWGMSMFALIISFLARNQVGAIVTFLLVPIAGESLLQLFLKDSSKYLPFNTLVAVLNGDVANYSNALAVQLTYIVVGLVVAIVLLEKRDAN